VIDTNDMLVDIGFMN